jgi:hypothetical protein
MRESFLTRARGVAAPSARPICRNDPVNHLKPRQELFMIRELQRLRSAGAGAFLEEIWRGDFYFRNNSSQKFANLL